MKTNIKKMCIEYDSPLVKGSTIKIKLLSKNNYEYVYLAHICHSIYMDTYYLRLNRCSSIIFTMLGINKEVFTNYILGYYLGGMWPECKTIQDLCILLTALECFDEW